MSGRVQVGGLCGAYPRALRYTPVEITLPRDTAMNVQTISKLAAVATLAAAFVATPARSAAQGGDTILKAAETQKLLPAAVYYKAQSAPTQLRNSGGVKFADGYYV